MATKLLLRFIVMITWNLIFLEAHNFTDLPINIMNDEIFKYLPINQQLFNLSLLNKQFYHKYFKTNYENDIKMINEMKSIILNRGILFNKTELKLFKRYRNNLQFNPLYIRILPQFLNYIEQNYDNKHIQILLLQHLNGYYNQFMHKNY